MPDTATRTPQQTGSEEISGAASQLRGHNLNLSRQEISNIPGTREAASTQRLQENANGGIVLRSISVLIGGFLELTVALEVARTLTNMGNTLNNTGADVTYGIVGAVGLVFIGLGIAAGGDRTKQSAPYIPPPNTVPYSSSSRYQIDAQPQAQQAGEFFRNIRPIANLPARHESSASYGKIGRKFDEALAKVERLTDRGTLRSLRKAYKILGPLAASAQANNDLARVEATDRLQCLMEIKLAEIQQEYKNFSEIDTGMSNAIAIAAKYPGSKWASQVSDIAQAVRQRISGDVQAEEADRLRAQATIASINAQIHRPTFTPFEQADRDYREAVTRRDRERHEKMRSDWERQEFRRKFGKNPPGGGLH